MSIVPNNIPGWVTGRELTILSTLAGYVPENGSILEIGCFLGRSTSALYNSKHSSVTLDVVDCFRGISSASINKPFDQLFSQRSEQLEQAYYRARDIAIKDGWQQAFKDCVGQEMYNNITVHPMNSTNFVKTKQYNLTFIDGDHAEESVLNDIQKCDTDVDLLVGDDFVKTFPGIAAAVNQFRRTRTLIVFQDTKLWVLVPKSGYWKELFKNNNLSFI